MSISSIMNSSNISSNSLPSLSLINTLPVILVLSSIVVLCICGNILVILSVFTFRPLRTVQNFFIVSLAFSDMLVAIMVMPFHIVTHILKHWVFGRIFCQVFVTSDVLLCTSSILNLCAIALDRYWAISDPIQYARQRTIRRVLAMILLVWVLSAIISIPPIIATMFGSNELQNFNEFQQCELSKNKAYVIYSACGSFYIPALIMTIVYAQVFTETRKRFRERAKAAAKLANATRIDRNRSLMNERSTSRKRHRRRNRRRHEQTVNGCRPEAFSSDDADETIESNIPHTQTSNRVMNDRLIPSLSSSSNRESDSRSLNNNEPLINAIGQDKNLGIEAKQNEIKDHIKVQPDENSVRRSLFKGKTLSTLMNERQKISLTRERRLSRTLGIIIGVFLLCWLPFFVCYILSAFIDVQQYVTEPFPTLALWLGYINSAFNPLIYTVFNVEFRTAFQRLLFSHWIHRTNTQKSIRN